MPEKLFTHYPMDDIVRLITVINEEMFTTVVVNVDRKMNLTASTETNLTKYLNEFTSNNTRVPTPILLAGDEVLMMATFMTKSTITTINTFVNLETALSKCKFGSIIEDTTMNMMHMDSTKPMAGYKR
ncbi:hypothetical protein QIS74_04901 [Colletotrichum tabaci]|uniref:Uncharacterized protein n=1 Tax=Colletotrichum tabaci TaxID=1209068 RepID=A0AAV9TGZ0_9PEZI